MARPALTEAQRSETKQKIRAAAVIIYREHGISNISVRGIAEKAGVSVGTLYAHFGSLGELLRSLWGKPLKRLVRELELVPEQNGDAKNRLQRLLETYADFSNREQAVFKNAFMYVRPDSIAAPERLGLDRDKFFSVFRLSVEEGQKTGIFRAGDSYRLTQIVLSAVHGSITMPVNMHRLALDNTPEFSGYMIESMLEWLQN